MAGFKTGGEQLAPDGRQIVFLRAEHADALRAGHFGIEVVFLGDLADGQQAVRGDFAAGGAWDHRVGAVFLDIAEEVVVGILQRRMLRLEDVFVPARGQQRADGGFTHFAAVAFAVFGQQCLERLDAFDADQVEQLLARIGEVFAQVVVDLDALLAQLGVQHG